VAVSEAEVAEAVALGAVGAAMEGAADMVVNVGEATVEDFTEATLTLAIEAVPVFAGRKMVPVVLEVAVASVILVAGLMKFLPTGLVLDIPAQVRIPPQEVAWRVVDMADQVIVVT